MKLSLATSLLLSAPILGYTPNNIRAANTPKTNPSPSALGYIDGKDAVDLVAFVPADEVSSTANSLATSLEVSDSAVREEYSTWLMKYDKVADETRYATFKQNFLAQEEWNEANGQAFTLNEFGDYSEGTHYLSLNMSFFVFYLFSTFSFFSCTSRAIQANDEARCHRCCCRC
jgi:hypothetical protein